MEIGKNKDKITTDKIAKYKGTKRRRKRNSENEGGERKIKQTNTLESLNRQTDKQIHRQIDRHSHPSKRFF